MTGPARRRMAVFIVPLVVGLVTSRNAAAHLRTVDFLLVFSCGALFGIGLMGIIHAMRTPMKPET
jgi:putative effector of murein hydrolase LrgA (UPF0299 family)